MSTNSQIAFAPLGKTVVIPAAPRAQTPRANAARRQADVHGQVHVLDGQIWLPSKPV